MEESVKSGGHIKLHHLTDFHLGAPDVDEQALKDRIALIEGDPQARWTFGGDGGDLIRFNDRRYKPDELHPRYRNTTDIRYATMEHLLELLGPIADKCWAYADGNHEEKMDHFYGGKFGCEVAVNLGIADKWVDYRGFVVVAFSVTKTQQHSLFIDLSHGWQAGRRTGAPQNQAELELSYTDADILLRGHSHASWAQPFETWTMSYKHNPKLRQRYVINGGTWRTGYKNPPPVNPKRLSEAEGSLWSERKGYRISAVGGPVLIIRVFTDGGGTNRRPGGFVMTAIEGEIDAETLGL